MKTVKLNGDNVVVLFWNRLIRATNEFDLIFSYIVLFLGGVVD